MNTLKESLVEYKSSLEFPHKEEHEAKEESRRVLLEVNELKKEVSGLKDKLAQTGNLQEKLLSLETYSCRENLIYDGLPESPEKNCEEKVYEILQNKINIWEAHEQMWFHRVQRLGHVNAGRPHPIIAKFCWAHDCPLTSGFILVDFNPASCSSNFLMKDDNGTFFTVNIGVFIPALF